MKNKIISFLILLLWGAVITASAQTTSEEITITTYYPSPYGVYNQLQTQRLGVGDVDGVGGFTAADVPTNDGDVWIAGNVGIVKLVSFLPNQLFHNELGNNLQPKNHHQKIGIETINLYEGYL